MSGPLRTGLLAAALVLAPALALADPITATAALAPVIGGAAAAFVVTNATALLFAAAFVVGNYQAKRAARKAREAYNASLEDRTVMIRTATGFHDLVLGRVRKSGIVYPIGQTGQYSEKMVFAVVLAGHECDGIEQIWFDDTPVELDADGTVTTEKWSKNATHSENVVSVHESQTSVTLAHTPVDGSVNVRGSTDWRAGNVQVNGRVVSWTRMPTNAGYNANKTQNFWVSYQRTVVTPKARVWWHLGTADQPADSRLIELFPATWNASRRLAGLCYLLVELDYDPDIFGAQPPEVSAVMRGAKYTDPRTGTNAWTDNPALLMALVTTHPLGGGLPAVAGEHDSIIVAANQCDTPATRTLTSSGGTITTTTTVPQYRAGFVHKGGTRAKDALDELAEAMCGKWAFVGHQLIVKAGGYTPPVLTLTDSDLTDAGDIDVSTGLPRDQIFNVVTGTFADAANGYEQLSFPRVASEPHIAADGVELPLDVLFAAITDVAQVQQVAATMIRDHREGLTLAASYNLAAWPLEVFDTYAQDSAVHGWTGKPFEVMSRGFSLAGLVRLSAKETAAAIYTQGTTFDAVDVAPNTNHADPRRVAKVQGLALLSDSSTMLQQSDGSIAPRIKATWQPVADDTVRSGGAVVLRYWPAHLDEADAAQTTEVSGGDVSAWLTGVQEGDLVIVKARARNGLPASSDWCVQVAVVVVGERAPASDVTGLGYEIKDVTVPIRWDANPDLDRAQTELRVVVGSATADAWPTAPHLWTGDATTYPWPHPGEGTYTVLAKHIDRSGNPSTTPAVLVVSVAASEILDGVDAVSAMLSSDAVALPADALGQVTSYAAAQTVMSIYQGVTDVTGAWTITRTNSSGVVSSLSGATVTVTALTDDAGWVDITATRAGQADLRKRFVLSKARAGAAGGAGVDGNDGNDGSDGINGNDGASAISAHLTQESITFPADAGGAVTSYAGNTSTLHVLLGQADDTANWTLAHSASAGLDVARSGATITISSMSPTVDAGTVTLTAGRAGFATLSKVVTVAKAKAGNPGQPGDQGNPGQPGDQGNPGQRGSVETFRTVAATAWSDSEAQAAIAAAGYGAPVLLDRVTLQNAAGTYVESRYYSAAGWVTWAALVNGNLIVKGSVTADVFASKFAAIDVLEVGSVSSAALFASGVSNRMLTSQITENFTIGLAPNSFQTTGGAVNILGSVKSSVSDLPASVTAVDVNYVVRVDGVDSLESTAYATLTPSIDGFGSRSVSITMPMIDRITPPAGSHGFLVVCRVSMRNGSTTVLTVGRVVSRIVLIAEENKV